MSYCSLKMEHTSSHPLGRLATQSPSETLVIFSPSDGGEAKQLEKQIETPAWRAKKRFRSRKTSSILRQSSHDECAFPYISLPKKSRLGFSYVGIRKENIKIGKSGNQSKLDAKELVKHQTRGLKPVCESFRRNRLNARAYKKLFSSGPSGARKVKASDNLLQRRDKLSQEGAVVTEFGERVVEGSTTNLKVQRMDYDVKQQLCHSNAILGHNLSGLPLSMAGLDVEVGLSKEHSRGHDDDVQSPVSHLDVQNDREHIACAICRLGGELLCCDGQECKKNFHLSCLHPPLTCTPPGVWHCIRCVQKKMQFGVHSVSEGVESILDAREVDLDHEDEVQKQKQYLAKYKGLAHVHNCWIPERQLLLENLELLAKYKRSQSTRWKAEWTLPHRLLQKRLLCLPKPCDGHNGKDLDCHYEWLVKWCGLGYDHATWELENAEFMKSPEALKLMRDFESRHKNAKQASCLSKEDKGGKITFSESSVPSSGDSPGAHNQCLSYVKKLHEFWHRKQNAVVFDGPERIVKIFLFTLSLDHNLPSLIITTSSSLPVWEAEFSRHESSRNIVVYKGDEDVRASIRSLEFFNEDGCVMFQVLLSPRTTVVEDMRTLQGIKWGAIIVDECQLPNVSRDLEQITALTAEMRLLLANAQIKNRRDAYHKLLSFLDPGLDGGRENASENDPNDIGLLKGRLACFVAYECKLHTPIVEYWVPVRLSNVQLEQYCAALLSNSVLLRSCSKIDTVSALSDIVISTRKCCDHPYLVDVDNSLRKSLTRDFSGADQLDVEIKVSGKLQLLEKFLLQIKERGLRVLILFQSMGGSGLFSIGDILDDFLQQRFGEDSYARFDGVEIKRSKKQAALGGLALFNSEQSDRFVFLMESRACIRSIKLSPVDTIILFDSDWDPLNDLKSLEKLNIESQSEQLKVFRLYSTYTVEEKVLVLAKQGVSLGSSILKMNKSTCHMLLTWGALHLVNKLDEFHAHDASVSHSNITSDESFMNDVVAELSVLLSYNGEDTLPNNSIILEVQQTDGAYPSNILLPGEVKAPSADSLSLTQELQHDEPPHVFWTSLLDRRQPRWKFLSGSSSRIRTRTKLFDGFSEEAEFAEDAYRRKRSMVRKRKLRVWGMDINMDAQCISRGRYGTNATSLEQRAVLEVGLRERAVNSITREPPTLELIGARPHRLPASTHPPSAECPVVSMPASRYVRTHQSRGRHDSDQQARDPMHPAREVSTTPPFSQPITLESPQLSADPLHMEMERILEDKEKVIKMHEDMILLLSAEYAKEMDEIRKKYDILLEDAEMALVQKRKDLETNYNKVYVNTLLAKAFMQKYDTKATESPRTQQTAARPTTTGPEHSITVVPMTGLPGIPPVQIVENSSAVQQTVARTTMGLEQSSSTVPMTVSPVILTAQMESHASASQQVTAATTVGTGQSIPILPMPDPSEVMQVLSTSSAAVQQPDVGTILREDQSLASLPTTALPAVSPLVQSLAILPARLDITPFCPISSGVSPVGGCEFRAPAPHLRCFIPRSRLPPLADQMPSQHSPTISSIPYCGLPQATKLPVHQPPPSVSGVNQTASTKGLPVFQGSFSAPPLPISTHAADIVRQFVTLPEWNSA